MTNLWIAIAAAAAVLIAAALAGALIWRERRLRQLELLRQANLERALAELRLTIDQSRNPSVLDAASRGDARERVPQVPDALVEACLEDDCLLFAGGGLAAQAGLPTWGELVSRIIRLHNDEDPADWSGLAQRVEFAPNGIADVVASRLPPGRLIGDVQLVKGSSDVAASPVFRHLSRIPFTGALTTSYDDFLERAFTERSPVVLAVGESENLPSYLRDRRFVIVKLYGDVTRPETFLFTADDYADALAANPTFERAVSSLFLSSVMLFLGVSLGGIDDFFGGLRSRNVTRTRPHYALVPWPEDLDVQRERYRGRYGVELLPYIPSPGHPEVVEFVANLATKAERRRDTSPPVTLQREVIDSVRLANIGPFRKLQLSLNGGWNLLLGNNGSGKSTLLRAIALVLCGDDERTRQVGTRLLRADSTSGWVEIAVGPDVYRTELIRDLNGVTVKASRLTPLQAGNWVILGFPPVRGITSRSSPPPPETSPHPLVSDVLPLLVGPTDDRLDDVKGWLVSQSLRAEGGRGISGAAAARARKLLDSFFGLLDELTPGLRLQFDHCDRSSWQVFVRSIDGVIPIELISQGTISVLGWVGTLLQRMYEIYPDAPQPESEPAIVLVDEVDAHMHPEWQKAMIPVLKRRLPGLQLIATTHSPLVAGSMESSEVTRIRRDPDSGDIVVEPIVEALKGMRADQILTSPAFDLETTRDRETVEMMNRYRQLLGVTQRSESEQAEFERVSGQLRQRVPTSPETPVERTALGVLEESILQQLEGRPLEEKQQILAEADRYLAELRSGTTQQ